MDKIVENKSAYRDKGIPQEIVFKILSRLPVKSLLQCKSVNKVWHALISSPEFIKEHLNRASNVDNFIFHRFMYIKVRPSSRQVLSQSFDFSTFNKVPASLPLNNQFVNAEVVAYCNGLVLLYMNHERHLLWNPSTRNYKEISGLHKNIQNIQSYTRLYGIAHDASIDEYTVISAARVAHLQNQETIVTVYNCRTNCCNYITGFPYWIFKNQQGAVVNGAPHWLVTHGHGDGEGCAIIYFDLSEETFKEVAKPDWAENGSELDLRAFKGLLCLVHYKRGYADIWVMEEYGEQGSWNKLYKYVRSLKALDVRPLGLTHNNAVVMEMEMEKSRAAIYNPVTHQFYNTNAYSCYNNGFNAVTYVESLVSPNSGKENM
ncbi:F-box/kelch-repeat protein At3g23880-like [Olea europaea var. sylvestris]|uniref:F-box kelch-repeat At3g23880-like n=1 Tax=Olea europaea subsp. europaea TaxID=158383 RepID=A0A8S0S1U5_OLEEU|nr:F-box/kelch-repeat protein At3g23880-like [Olea europaea var. sylvestris]CAA2985545.1 F-box kelch-repeat At3g23880-like [Olea europaea subsp. europaea]